MHATGAAATPAPVLGPGKSVGAPIEIPGGLSATRQYYQTRSVITLNVTGDGATPGDDVSLLDDSSGASLVNHQSLGLKLDGEETPDAYLADQSYDITIKLYPSAPAYAGRFNYGANKLRLLVNDMASPRFSQNTIYLNDFTYFALATGAFPTNVQQTGGFQGNVDVLTSPVVTNGVGTLTTGPIAIMNQ